MMQQGYSAEEFSLSEVEQELVDFLRAYIAGHGYPPSVREIGHGVRRSVAWVHEHLGDLEEAGVLTRVPRRSRSIAMTDPVVREAA